MAAEQLHSEMLQEVWGRLDSIASRLWSTPIDQSVVPNQVESALRNMRAIDADDSDTTKKFIEAYRKELQGLVHVAPVEPIPPSVNARLEVPLHEYQLASGRGKQVGFIDIAAEISPMELAIELGGMKEDMSSRAMRKMRQRSGWIESQELDDIASWRPKWTRKERGSHTSFTLLIDVRSRATPIGLLLRELKTLNSLQASGLFGTNKTLVVLPEVSESERQMLVHEKFLVFARSDVQAFPKG